MKPNRVRDLGFAAFLIVKGYVIENTEVDGRTVWFNFTEPYLDLPPIEYQFQEYNYRRAEAPAKEFNSAIQTLKGEIVKLLKGDLV